MYLRAKVGKNFLAPKFLPTFAPSYSKKGPYFMNESLLDELFAAHDIKPTANRQLVARELHGSHRPLSLAELEERLLTMDRSSIFRALSLFRDHHLVHVIEGGGEGVHYELCLSHNHASDDDQHAHFLCEHCRRTFCLEDSTVPLISLPEGFVMSSVTYLVKGLCPQCARLPMDG